MVVGSRELVPPAMLWLVGNPLKTRHQDFDNKCPRNIERAPPFLFVRMMVQVANNTSPHVAPRRAEVCQSGLPSRFDVENMRWTFVMFPMHSWLANRKPAIGNDDLAPFKTPSMRHGFQLTFVATSNIFQGWIGSDTTKHDKTHESRMLKGCPHRRKKVIE